MADETKMKKVEEAAEKTEQVVEKGLKKGFGAIKALGKGTKDLIEDKKKKV